MPHRSTRPAHAPPGTELLGRPPMPRASLGVRAKTSPLLRTAVPVPVQLARAEAKAGRLWQAGGETRADALRAMRAVVAGTHVEPELAQVARRHLLEGAAWEILFWRRWP